MSVRHARGVDQQARHYQRRRRREGAENVREISRCNAKVLRQPCPDIAILKDSDAAVSYGFESVVGRCSVDLKARPDFR